VCYSNFVPKTHHFPDIRLQKYCDPEIRVRGHSTSLKVVPFDLALKPCLWVTEGHQYGHRLIHPLWLPISVPQQPWAYLVPVLRLTVISVEHSTIFRPRSLCAPAEGFPLELRIGAGGQKLEWWGYGPKKKFDDIFSRVYTTQHECDGRTDGHRTTAKTALMYSVVQ